MAGFVVVHPETDHPDRFSPGARFHAGSGSLLEVEESRPVEARGGPGTLFLVRFRGVTDRESAEELRGETLSIPADQRRPLQPGEFWPDELAGLEVRYPDGERVGTVVEVVEGAAQDRLVVETATGRAEIPFVAELVPEIDPERNLVVIARMEGLVD